VNSLFPGAKGSNATSGASFGNGSVRIPHREYIQDVFTGPGAGIFNIESWAVNPGLSSFSPWLAPMAGNYEEYHFEGLVVEFISSTSNFNSNSAMGTVIIAMSYNPAATPFASKTQMENSDFALSARFDRSMLYGVECKKQALNEYFVRQQTSDIPITSTDFGRLYLATMPAHTFPTNSTIGELWIAYDIVLSKPRLSNFRYGYAHFSSNFDIAASGDTEIPMLTAGVYSRPPVIYGAFDEMVITNDNSNDTILTFPDAAIGDVYSMTWIVTYSAVVTGATAIAPISEFNFTDADIIANGSQAASTASDTFSAVYVGYFRVSSVTSTPEMSFQPIVVTNGGAALTATVDLILTDLGNGYANQQL
jgi:hypothetical protein